MMKNFPAGVNYRSTNIVIKENCKNKRIGQKFRIKLFEAACL